MWSVVRLSKWCIHAKEVTGKGEGWIISCLESLTIDATDDKVIVIVFCKKVEANNGCSYIIFYADGLTDSCAVDVNQVGI